MHLEGSQERSFEWGAPEPSSRAGQCLITDRGSSVAMHIANAGCTPTGNTEGCGAVTSLQGEPEGGEGSSGPQCTVQEVGVGDFGDADSVRITAPVAAQHDLDTVAKVLRKAGVLRYVLCCLK